MTAAKVALGKALFEDRGLSGAGTISCASCHLEKHGYAVPVALGPAYPSKAERRNSPTLINVAFNLPLIWDGRAGALDKQPLGSLGNVLHLNNNADLVVEQLKADRTYRRMFAAAFSDDAITKERIGLAIGSFERTLVFEDSPLDRYMDGEGDALSEPQKRGLALFLGEASCATCHNGPNLTDLGFHNLGVPDAHVTGDAEVMASVRFDSKRKGLEAWATVREDVGRELVTKDPADRGKFRTMGLRNVEETGPYMHNGAFETLDEVVAFYNKGGGEHDNKSPLMQPLGLSDAEVQDLVAFLRALSGNQRAFELP